MAEGTLLQDRYRKARAKKRGGSETSHNRLIFLARPEGFEPPACGFEVRRSIRLSYGRMRAT